MHKFDVINFIELNLPDKAIDKTEVENLSIEALTNQHDEKVIICEMYVSSNQFKHLQEYHPEIAERLIIDYIGDNFIETSKYNQYVSSQTYRQAEDLMLELEEKEAKTA